MTEAQGSAAAARAKRGLVRAAQGLMGAAVVLLVLAKATPWHTDADAYFEGLRDIRAQLYDHDPQPTGIEAFHQASRDFHELQDRYETAKWLYADLGYAASAWSLLLFVTAAANPTLRPSRRWKTILPASLAGVALMVLGVFAAAVHASGRYQVPEWSDTLAIPLFGAFGLGLLLLPVVLSLALAPLILTRRRPASLWPLRGRGWTASSLVTLVYLAPIGLATGATALLGQPGGWAVSTGGAILLWLMLNARAVWLGRPPADDAPLP